MKYRRLGQWGVQVSTISFGSWLTIRNKGAELAQRLHRAAYENGVNFFDTANVYGNGETEALVGESLAPFRRDTYVLATKVYFPYGEHPFPGVNDRGLSRKHIFEQCHHSLCELRTDYIDLYQCHRFDANAPLHETCRAFNDLIAQGKVLYWGVSEWTSDQIREAVSICDEHDWPRPASNQPVYNMLERGVEKNILQTCASLGLGVVVFSPLAQGILTGKYQPGQAPPSGTRAADEKQGQWMRPRMTEENLRKAADLAKVAEGMGCTASQLALAWCLRRSELSSCIVGATKVEQLRENIAAAEIDLHEAVLDRINMILGV
ncbi:MAG: aldo/keto reductase family protein [Phycisphaerales bacterium]|nr:aldo/keto reductase family protein [Phycisphaerales bacterium]